MLIRPLHRRLFLPCLFLLGSLLSGQSFEIVRSSVDGVDLIGPGSEEFDMLVSSEIANPDVREDLQSVLAYSVFVRNQDSRPIRLVAIRLGRIDGRGNEIHDILLHDVSGLADGSSFLLNPVGPVHDYADSRAQASLLQGVRRLERSSAVTASLDAVVYKDGELIGPDLSDTFEYQVRLGLEQRQFIRELRGKSELSDSELINYLQEKQREPLLEVGGRLVSVPKVQLQILERALSRSREVFDRTLGMFERDLDNSEVWRR